MKFNAALFCLIPWILLAFTIVIKKSVPEFSLEVVALTFMMVSPMFTAFGLLVAYRAGQWSKE